MGFLGTLYLGLFVWCIHKTRDKKQIKERSPENNAALEEVKKESKVTSQEKNGNYIKEEYLKYINKLYTDGVISEEEYKTEIKKIINN